MLKDCCLGQLSSFWDRFLLFFRNLGVRLGVIEFFQSCRMVMHFGPWRHFFIVLTAALAKQLRSVKRGQDVCELQIDTATVLRNLSARSVQKLGVLPSHLTASLVECTSNLPAGEYKLVHEVIPQVKSIIDDTTINKLLLNYFECPPVLLECSLFVTEKPKKPHAQNTFHIDFAGWKSLNLFVYLTDVNENNSYHIVIQGSHNHSLKGAFRQTIPNEVAERRFGDKITPIYGKAGTLFMENTEAFHRRQLSSERRVMLNVLFASHKGWLSYGRTSKDDRSLRDKYLKTPCSIATEAE